MAHIKKGSITGRPAHNSGGLSLTIGSTVSGGTRGAVTARSGKIIPKEDDDFYYVKTDNYVGFNGVELVNFIFTNESFNKFNGIAAINDYKYIVTFYINTTESFVTQDVLNELIADNFYSFDLGVLGGLGGDETTDDGTSNTVTKWICFEQNGTNVVVNNDIINELNDRVMELAKIFMNLQNSGIDFDNISINNIDQLLSLLKPYLPPHYIFLIKNLFLETNLDMASFQGLAFYSKLFFNSIPFKKYGESGRKLTIYICTVDAVDADNVNVLKDKIQINYNKITREETDIVKLTTIDLDLEESTFKIVKSPYSLDDALNDFIFANSSDWGTIENSNQTDYAVYDNADGSITIYNIDSASSSESDGSWKMYVKLFDGIKQSNIIIPEFDDLTNFTVSSEFIKDTDDVYKCWFEINDSGKLVKSTKSYSTLLTTHNTEPRFNFYEFGVFSDQALTTNVKTAMENYAGTAYILTKLDNASAEITTIKNNTTKIHNFVLIELVVASPFTIKPKSFPIKPLKIQPTQRKTSTFQQSINVLKTLSTKKTNTQYPTLKKSIDHIIPHKSKEQIRKEQIKQKILSEIERRNETKNREKQIKIQESKERFKEQRDKRRSMTNERLEKLIDRRIEKMINDGSMEKLLKNHFK
jgi:hypothetical protein